MSPLYAKSTETRREKVWEGEKWNQIILSIFLSQDEGSSESGCQKEEGEEATAVHFFQLGLHRGGLRACLWGRPPGQGFQLELIQMYKYQIQIALTQIQMILKARAAIVLGVDVNMKAEKSRYYS